MGYVVRMPKLGLEMERGVVLEWKLDVGDAFEEGDVLVEIESEKSIGEVEAREDGTLRHVYVEEGEEVPPSTPIGIVAAPDADISDLRAEAEADLEGEASEATGEAEAAEAESDTATAEASAGSGGGTAARSAGDGADVKASPRAKKRAEELGVSLTAVEGTGPMDSVTEEDVEAAAEAGAEPTGSPAEATGVRRVAPGDDAADRYGHTTAVADPSAANALFETTEAVRTAFEERVTTTDVLFVVASATLADHPAMNGTYAEATHQIRATQDIALVAEVDGEPVAGVVPDARNRSLSEVVDARQAIDASGDEVADRATFTLANAAETDAGGRLVNPPAVAALEVDPTGQRAVPDGDGIDLQPLVVTGLTYDTRAVGGAEARAFLERFHERIEQASELVLGSYRGRE